MEWLKYLAIQKDENGILINGYKQGAHYVKYPNGQLKYERSYDHEQLHGIQKMLV
jgi:antitoxin component YwqK of YwqJK toxin-antitoxin module